MLDPLLRPVKNRLLEAPARGLVAVGLGPGIVTGAGLVAGLAAAVAVVQGAFGWALVGWGINRVLDGLDGTVARQAERTSDLGGYLDLFADFLVYAAIVVALVVREGAPLGTAEAGVWMLAAFYLNVMSWAVLSGLLEKRRLPQADTALRMPDALVGGSETIVLYTLFLALPVWTVPLFELTAVLVAISAFQRLFQAIGLLRDR